MSEEIWQISINNFEGPLDLLLNLARAQQVDLRQISMTQLCDKYLEFIDKSAAQHLDLTAEYLVMASYLTYLKSQLLIPQDQIDEPEEFTLTRQALLILSEIQEKARELQARPQWGSEFFTRGMAQNIMIFKKSLFNTEINELILAYAYCRGRQKIGNLAILPTNLESTEIAIQRLELLLPKLREWINMEQSFDKKYPTKLQARSAFAATLCAILEMNRDAKIQMRQADFFGNIEIKAKKSEGDFDA